MGIFGKCNPIESMGYMESMRIKDNLVLKYAYFILSTVTLMVFNPFPKDKF